MAVKIPAFTYSGTYRTELKGDRWYIFFLTSGTLRMTYAKTADLYLHGGGGGGSGGGYNSNGGSGGGGGYFSSRFNIGVLAAKDYKIVVGKGGGGGYYGGSGVGSAGDGKAGGESSAFGYSVDGGGGGEHMGTGGAGGSGKGGLRGSSVGGSGNKGGSNATYAFGDSTLGLIYGGGGGGGRPESGGAGAGGSPSGAEGGKSAAANTGAGGGGGAFEGIGGTGGSGIVILRSTQDDQLPVKFDGVTLQRILFNGEEVMHLIHDGTQIFIEKVGRWFERLRRRMRFALHGRSSEPRMHSLTVST